MEFDIDFEQFCVSCHGPRYPIGVFSGECAHRQISNNLRSLRCWTKSGRDTPMATQMDQ